MKLKIIKRMFIVIVFGIFILYSYIWASTLLINKKSYIKLTQKIANSDSSLSGGYNVKVDLVKIVDKIDYIIPISTNGRPEVRKFNKILLALNGYRAIRVDYEPKRGSLMGDLVIFINPFTKQIIGVVGRQ